MAGATAQQPPTKIERTIGSTTYIVTSHFPETGITAIDKIKRLIDLDTKAEKICRNN